jgi:hypothetical protein
MNFPFAAHTWTIIALASVAIVAAFYAINALKRQRNVQFWLAFGLAISTLTISGTVFLRLDRLHTDLLDGSPGIKTKQDLLQRYGTPTRTDSYVYAGQNIECWIYEVRLFSPHILKQFEMVHDTVTASIGTNNI